MEKLQKGITVAGSLIADTFYFIDSYPKEGLLTKIRKTIHYAGGTGNLILDLAKLDSALPVKVCAIIGEDENGNLLESALSRYPNIDLSGVTREGESSVTHVVNAQDTHQRTFFFHPAATCPILLHWRRNCLLAGGCGRCNMNKWRYQLEQEYFQKPDDYRCGLYPAGRPGLLWHHAPFQCGFEGPDRSGKGVSRGDSPWHLYHGGYG